MNKLQKAFWLAKKNFIRGVFVNIASVLLIVVSNLVLFSYFLVRFNISDLQCTQNFVLITVFTFVILFVVFISLIAIHSLNIKARYHEIALLKGIGAERSFIKMMLFSEIGFLAVVAMLFSSILIIIAVAFFGNSVFTFINSVVKNVGAFNVLLVALLSFVINIIIVFLSVIMPIQVVSRIEPYFAIRKRE